MLVSTIYPGLELSAMLHIRQEISVNSDIVDPILGTAAVNYRRQKQMIALLEQHINISHRDRTSSFSICCELVALLRRRRARPTH